MAVDSISVLSAALAVGLSAIGAGYAEAHIGASAVAVSAEDDENFGKALILTVIPETLGVFGLVVSLIILFVI